MSIRTEPRNVSADLARKLTITPEQVNAATLSSAGLGDSKTPDIGAAAAGPEGHLAAANDFHNTAPEHPLSRTVVVNIRASLADLCLKSSRATWRPASGDSTRAIFQQRKFVDLGGNIEAQGDLKSVVLHKLSVGSQKSTFPFSLGVRLPAVDDATFSSTGEAYSMITLPEADSHNEIVLQEDDTALAYEFARKFPGYTANNLKEKGVHEVSARRFCLIAADHPLVSAISENAEKLQLGDVAMMPEGLVKISSGLYDTVMPMVEEQIKTQIHVRDLSDAAVTIAPADYSSWTAVRDAMLSEKKAALKAKVQMELAACANQDALADMKAEFAAQERDLEHSIDHDVHTFSASINVAYNFLSK